MAVLNGGPAQMAARAMMVDVIREELARGQLNSTNEMLGYVIKSFSTAEAYNRTPAEPVKRRIASPEFLSGLMTDEMA